MNNETIASLLASPDVSDRVAALRAIAASVRPFVGPLTDEQVLKLARTDGWDYDTSPDTEMSNENWYRFDACTAAREEEDLIDLYRRGMRGNRLNGERIG